MRAPAAAAAALLLLAACGRAADATPAAAPSATAGSSPLSTSPAPPTAAPAPWQLQLTGDLAGTFHGAVAQGPCGALPGGFGIALPFSYEGRGFVLDVAILDYTGPGSYPAPPARISVHSAGFGGGPPVFYSGVKGTLVVAADGTSGTLDEDLAGQSATAHVTGSWRC